MRYAAPRTGLLKTSLLDSYRTPPAGQRLLAKGLYNPALSDQTRTDLLHEGLTQLRTTDADHLVDHRTGRGAAEGVGAGLALTGALGALGAAPAGVTKLRDVQRGHSGGRLAQDVINQAYTDPKQIEEFRARLARALSEGTGRQVDLPRPIHPALGNKALTGADVRLIRDLFPELGQGQVDIETGRLTRRGALASALRTAAPRNLRKELDAISYAEAPTRNDVAFQAATKPLRKIPEYLRTPPKGIGRLLDRLGSRPGGALLAAPLRAGLSRGLFPAYAGGAVGALLGRSQGQDEVATLRASSLDKDHIARQIRDEDFRTAEQRVEEFTPQTPMATVRAALQGGKGALTAAPQTVADALAVAGYV